MENKLYKMEFKYYKNKMFVCYLWIQMNNSVIL